MIYPEKNICYFCRDLKVYDDLICEDCKDRLDIINREIELDYFYKVYYVSIYTKYMKKQISDFKYNDKNYLYKPLGKILLENFQKMDIDIEIDYITYIPSHKRKKVTRGYNQSELLARYLGKELGIEVINDLIKTKNTRDQNKLEQEERFSNLKGVFNLRNKSKYLDKNILLVDDVITTGTTMVEAGKVLKDSGSGLIIGLGLSSSLKL